MPGGINIIEWLLDRPEFGEAGNKNARFVGVCTGSPFNVFRTNQRPGDGEKIISRTLKFPEGYPVKTAELEIAEIPDDWNSDDTDIKELAKRAEKSFSYFLMQQRYLFRLTVGIDDRVIAYIHQQMAPILTISSPVDGDGNTESYWQYISAIRQLTNFVARHLVICCNLCLPGSVDLGDSFVKVGNSGPVSNNSYKSPLTTLSDAETRAGIRLLRQLDFTKTWEFYTNICGTLTELPSKPIEIAISNLTDLFDENSDHSGARNLIWGFAGLEALLADNETSIGSQLRQKLIALFGTQVDVVEFEKEIANIYKYRSKVIHGKAKSGSVLSNWGGSFYQPKSETKETETAIWLLVAVIQYCIQNKLSDLKFKTVVV